MQRMEGEHNSALMDELAQAKKEGGMGLLKLIFKKMQMAVYSRAWMNWKTRRSPAARSSHPSHPVFLVMLDGTNTWRCQRCAAQTIGARLLRLTACCRLCTRKERTPGARRRADAECPSRRHRRRCS